MPFLLLYDEAYDRRRFELYIGMPACLVPSCGGQPPPSKSSRVPPSGIDDDMSFIIMSSQEGGKI